MLDVADAASRGDVVMVLLPDEKQAEVWEAEIRDGIAPGNLLMFAHGFSIHFGADRAAAGASTSAWSRRRAPGHLVRRQYEEGRGVPCLMAVHQDATGNARDLVLAYASGIGGGRAGIIETTFKDECETDLFGEQAVLCGGATELVRAGFETLVEAGYDPRLAYFECLHELKLIVDLMYEKGIQGMRYSISNTAEYGDMTRGPRVIGARGARGDEADPRRHPVGRVRQGVDRREPRRRRELPADARGGRRPPGRERRQGPALDDALDRPGVLGPSRVGSDGRERIAPVTRPPPRGVSWKPQLRHRHRHRHPPPDGARAIRRPAPAAATRSASRPIAPSEYNRFMPLVKWLLAFPHYIVLFFLVIGAFFALVVSFFAVLFTGRWPRGLFDFIVGAVRWGYAGERLRLPAHRPVPAVLARGRPVYPVRLEIDYPEHVDNWRPLVHWLLIIPYYIVAYLLLLVAGVVASSSWSS